jgi:NAD(P)-dependent dehydrogenase (short-subunit alcohol dehydrogenase family)
MGSVIVTGGLGVLGRAVVTTLKERGHRLAAVDLASGESDADIVIGGVDLTDEAAVATAFASAAEQLGGVDALINIAGGFLWEPVETGSVDSWDAMYRINVRTAAISSRAVLAHLHKGAIVNVGAAAASNAGLGMGPYAAAKAGVMALTESLAEELRGRGIRVNAVLPTVLDTPTNRKDMPEADTSGWVSPQDAAKAMAFLISADAAAVTGCGIRLSLGQGAATE